MNPRRPGRIRGMLLRHLLILVAAVPLLSAAERPNIILVMTDDQGYGPVGRHGHPWIRTPHLDRLHDQSTRFKRFLVSPTCSPTRAAIMTGRHPMKDGITHTINERDRMALDATILPQVLKSAGYTTGIFGKWHLGDEDPYQPGERGFDEAFIHGAGGIGQAFNCSNADAPGNKYFDPVIRHNGRFVKTKGFCTDIFFTAALGWIREQKDQPFFAYISTNAPHGPFIAPPENTEYFTDKGFSKKHAGFYGMVENIDENMGRLMDRLKEWELEENTILIFMSDNGMTGNGAGKPGETLTPDHAWFNAGMRGLKGSPDEGGVRVPFFIRWNGKVPAGGEVETMAAHIDILPTLAAVAGADLPEGQVEGRDLWPLIKGGKIAWRDRHLFTHVARWGNNAEPNDFQWKNFAVSNHRFRLVGRDKLYDIINDPGQETNVIGDHPEMVERMLSAYDRFWKETRPRMVNEGVPMSKTRPYHVAYRKQEEEGGIPEWTPPEGL